ncbi:helix-turn-helix transcriptional regulator [Nigerium massiliense]|uniref:helix-turn-helix transcriptional regulator n=1 Tax=Nigerium massiliense TaxID=1522317 RepID=UPI00058B9468|nr:helix-turn-helix transcriptional regulator [Nigerium massiliense]
MGTTPHAQPPGDAALTAAFALARERFADGLTVTDLADEAGYSPFHFTRLFTAARRVPPGQYLTALRIEQAKRLLLTTSDAVIDVATAVGFDSLSSFSRRFRTAVGVTPAGLRALADRVSDRPVRPFRLGGDPADRVTVVPNLPEPERGQDWQLWLGWYAQPVPVGLPSVGVLTEGTGTVRLPLCPGSPWLLTFAVRERAGVLDQLAPSQPLVGLHPEPLTAPQTVTITYFRANADEFPLLSALPSMDHRRR